MTNSLCIDVKVANPLEWLKEIGPHGQWRRHLAVRNRQPRSTLLGRDSPRRGNVFFCAIFGNFDAAQIVSYALDSYGLTPCPCRLCWVTAGAFPFSAFCRKVARDRKKSAQIYPFSAWTDAPFGRPAARPECIAK